jgi:hypothetical protein
MGVMSTSAVQQLYDVCKATFCGGGGGGTDLPSSPIALERVRLALGMFMPLSLSLSLCVCVHVCLCAFSLHLDGCVCVFPPIHLFIVFGSMVCEEEAWFLVFVLAKMSEWMSEWH